MKSIFLLNMKFRVFLTEIPPLILLAISIYYNNDVSGLFKLYPLIIFLSAVAVFIPVYFIRGVIIGYDEVRCVGVFSSHSSAFIDENKTLVITALKKRKIRIELFEKSNGEEVFSWMKSEPDREINVFRAKANGTEKTLAKILKLLSQDEKLARTVFETEIPETDLGDISVRSRMGQEGKELIIHFNKTV